MSFSYTIEIPPETQKFMQDFADFGDQMLRSIAEEMDAQNQLTIAEVSQKRVSFPREGPTVPDGLRLHTGLLRRSLFATPAVIVGTAIVSEVGAAVKYAKIHEFGGRTKPHVIKPRKGKALAFSIGGKTILAGKVNHPGSKMPARRYVGRTLDERAPQYIQAFGQRIATDFSHLG